MVDVESLETKHEWVGEWWLPETPQKTAHGNLVYDPRSGIALTLHGGIGNDPKTERGSPRPVILGRCHHAVITVLQNWNLGWATTTGGEVIEQTISPELVIVGRHVHEIGSERISAVHVHFLHLESWADIGELGRAKRMEIDDGERFTIEASVPAAQKYAVGNIATLEVLPYLQDGSDGSSSSSIKYKVSLSLRADGHPWFDWFRPKLRHLERLLSLLIQTPVRPTRLSAAFTGERDDALLASLYFIRPQGGFRDRIDSRFIPVPLSSIRDRFSSVLTRWFENEDRYGLPADLYLQSLHYGGASYTVPFLDLMRAIEVFDRRTRGGRYHDRETYKRTLLPQLHTMVGKLSSDFDVRFIEKLKGSMGYADEISLADRMTEILQAHPYMPGFSPPDDFPRKLAATRNHLTHYGGKPSKLVFQEERQLSFATLYLQSLLSYLMLRELGFEKEDALEAMSRSFQLMHH